MRITLKAALEWIAWKLTRNGRHPEDPTSVFVSYAHEDEEVISGLIAELDKRGIKAVQWFAPKQLRPGDHLDPKIRKAIDQAKYFLVAVTRAIQKFRVGRKGDSVCNTAREKRNQHQADSDLLDELGTVPESLRDYLAIDIREIWYKAGFEEQSRCPEWKTFLG